MDYHGLTQVASGDVLRGVANLSIGTTLARILAVVAQSILIVWLDPEQFAHWALASAAMAAPIALRNFGQVAGFLANPSIAFDDIVSRARRENILLGLLSLPIAGYLAFVDRTDSAVLVLLLGIAIPFQGEADLWYAQFVDSRRTWELIAGQVAASVARLVCAVAIGAAFESSLAFGLSYIVLHATQIAFLRGRRGVGVRKVPPGRPSIGQKDRRRWAVNAVSLNLAAQVDYLVVAAIASPVLLGLYFFAYQATVGVSGTVGLPLSRIALSALAAGERGRDLLAASILARMATIATVVVVGAATTVIVLGHLLPDQWAPAAPAIALLLGSVPARLMVPVVAALDQAWGRWSRNSVINAVDCVGTAIACLAAIGGDLLILCLSVSIWKTAFAIIRVFDALRRTSVRGAASIAGIAMTSTFACTILGLHAREVWISPWTVSVIVLALSIPVLLSFRWSRL